MAASAQLSVFQVRVRVHYADLERTPHHGEAASSLAGTSRSTWRYHAIRDAFAVDHDGSYLMNADLAVLRALRTRGHGRRLERAAMGLSRMGEHSRLWFSLTLAGIVRDRGRRSVYARLGAALIA